MSREKHHISKLVLLPNDRCGGKAAQDSQSEANEGAVRRCHARLVGRSDSSMFTYPLFHRHCVVGGDTISYC